MKFSLLSFILGAAALSAIVENVAESKVIFCYYESWAVYRTDSGKFDVTDVDPNLCTHISFAFLGLKETGEINILDPWASNEDGLNGFNNIVNLKNDNPDLKVLISLGGWNEGSEKYSKVVADPSKRSVLVQSLMDIVETFGFDGIDFDWNYPCQRDGSSADDKEHFVLLLEELKTACVPNGYILSAAVSSSKERIETSYNIPSVLNHLDFINVMSYDFHGDFENFVGHHTPLFSGAVDAQFNNSDWNIDFAIQYWLESGVDPAKINLGIATYARTFTLADSSNSDLYAPVIGGGKPGRYTNTTGVLGYNEICEDFSSFDAIWDDEELVPHLVVEDQWIGYDIPESIAIKVNYALDNNLGGFMVWSLGTDDFSGNCGDGNYPLINTIRNNINARGYTIGN